MFIVLHNMSRNMNIDTVKLTFIVKLEVIPSVKLLALNIDAELSFNFHVEKLWTKLSQRIGILKKISSCLPMRQKLLFYNSTIRLVVHYVSSVWTSCDKENLSCVLKLQKGAAREIFDADNPTSSVNCSIDFSGFLFMRNRK